MTSSTTVIQSDNDTYLLAAQKQQRHIGRSVNILCEKDWLGFLFTAVMCTVGESTGSVDDTTVCLALFATQTCMHSFLVLVICEYSTERAIRSYFHTKTHFNPTPSSAELSEWHTCRKAIMQFSAGGMLRSNVLCFSSTLCHGSSNRHTVTHTIALMLQRISPAVRQPRGSSTLLATAAAAALRAR